MTRGTRRSSKERKERRRGTARFRDSLAKAFVLAALLLGGAGSSFPLANWLIVTLGAAVLVERLPELRWSAFDRNARFAAWLLLATAGFVVLQILPLPRGLWAAMPGHALAAQIADAAGSGGWTAWSLSPDRTIEALAGLVPFAAALAIAARADGAQRLALLRLVLVVALASAVLAVIQVGAGPGSAPMLFASRHRGLGVGLFVNRNHFALFLLFAMLIAALPGVPAFIRKVQNPAAAEWGLRLGASLLLTLGVIATLSRAGMFLLPVALTAAFLISRRGRVRVPLLLGGIVLAGLAALLLRSVPVVQVLLERFATAAEDFRFQYWANTLDAARDALPFGTGLGTFTLVYPQFEPLDQMRPDVVNHAHNDVLELLLEGGIAAALLLLAWIVFVALAAGRARKVATTRRERYVPLVAAIAAGLAFAASLVDYPLRMSAIAVTLALLVGMACRIAPVQAAAAQESQGRARHWALATPLVLAALLALSSDWARQFAAAGQPRLATGIAPWSGEVQSAAATRYQVMGENAAASRAARRALAVSPLDPAAVRAEGMAALALGRAEQGAALLSLGARLGWRDILNQL